MPGLLEGVKVIDLSRYFSGPYCTKLFATLGAEVIKIESPSNGDPIRRYGPFASEAATIDSGAWFLYLNTSKQSVTLDIKSDQGREILKDLIKSADILVENFSPNTIDGLGLSYDELHELNPQLVVTSISNYGQTGPYKDWKGTELNLYATGGLMNITGEPEDTPLKEGAPLAQLGTGQNAFVASMTALMYAEETGLGQHIDIAIAEYATNVLENALMQYSYSGQEYSRVGNRGYGRAAWGIYPCKDGFVGVIAGPEHRWSAMAELMDEPRLAEKKYTERSGRQIYAEEIEALMEPWLMSHNKQEIFEKAQELGLAFAFVATPEDILNWEHLDNRGYLPEISHPEAGSYKYAGAAFQAVGIEAEWQRAPVLGEHNDEVLSPIIENLNMKVEDLKLEETI